MPTHEFHSLLEKMNNEQCFIFDDVMYGKNNPNEPIHLFIIGSAGIDETFTLMLLIQALIHFYNRHPHSNPLKKKALLMAYIGKSTFNIDEITIHSSLSIPLNCKDLPSLSLERLDNLVKKYDQLQLIFLDEISLIGKRILKFIDLQLISIKRIHTNFFGNLDVIITRNFYQVQLVRDVRSFKINANNIDSLIPNFWMEKIKC
jgi:hypothetical protein